MKQDWRSFREKDRAYCAVMAGHFMSWLEAARAGDWMGATRRARACAGLLERFQTNEIRQRAQTVGWGVNAEAQRLKLLAPPPREATPTPGTAAQATTS